MVVAREESITRAAQALHITQPTLSRQIAQMEEEMGVKLLDRQARKVSLTEEGLLLRPPRGGNPGAGGKNRTGIDSAGRKGGRHGVGGMRRFGGCADTPAAVSNLSSPLSPPLSLSCILPLLTISRIGWIEV